MNNIQGISLAQSKDFNDRDSFTVDLEETQDGTVAVFKINNASCIYTKRFLFKTMFYLKEGTKVKIDCGMWNDVANRDLIDIEEGKLDPKRAGDRTKFIASEILPIGIFINKPTESDFAKEITKIGGVSFTSDTLLSEVKSLDGKMEKHLYIVLSKLESKEVKKESKSKPVQKVFVSKHSSGKEKFLLTGYEITDEDISYIINLIDPDEFHGKIVELVVGDSLENSQPIGVEIIHGDGDSEIDMHFLDDSVLTSPELYVPIIVGLVNKNRNLLIKDSDNYGKDKKGLTEMFISRERDEVAITVDDFSDDDNKMRLQPMLNSFISKGCTILLDVDEYRPSSVDDYEIRTLVDNVVNETGIDIRLKEEIRGDINEETPCFVLEPVNKRKKV